MIFQSALRTANEASKYQYLKHFFLLGEGLPQKESKIPTARDVTVGNNLQKYCDLLKEEYRQRANSAIHCRTKQSKQNSVPLTLLPCMWFFLFCVKYRCNLHGTREIFSHICNTTFIILFFNISITQLFAGFSQRGSAFMGQIVKHKLVKV